MIIQLLLISYNYLLFPARPCCFTLYILYSHSVVPLACLVCKQSADSWVLFPAEPDIPNGASTFKALHSTSNVTVVQSVNVFFHVASYWIFPLCFLTICLSVTVPVSAFEILMQVYVCFFLFTQSVVLQQQRQTNMTFLRIKCMGRRRTDRQMIVSPFPVNADVQPLSSKVCCPILNKK